MRLRSVAGRLGMACYAVWVALALVTQDATPCPTHDGPAAAAVAMAMMPGMHMGGATDAATSHTHGGMHAHDASHGAHHGCRCVGCGCCVAVLDLWTPAATLVPAPATVARGTTAPLAPTWRETRRVDRLLPFANAPPVMVSAAV